MQIEDFVTRAIAYAKQHDGEDWSVYAAINHVLHEVPVERRREFKAEIERRRRGR